MAGCDPNKTAIEDGTFIVYSPRLRYTRSVRKHVDSHRYNIAFLMDRAEKMCAILYCQL